jgi:hypothetical protein
MIIDFLFQLNMERRYIDELLEDENENNIYKHSTIREMYNLNRTFPFRNPFADPNVVDHDNGDQNGVGQDYVLEEYMRGIIVPNSDFNQSTTREKVQSAIECFTISAIFGRIKEFIFRLTIGKLTNMVSMGGFAAILFLLVLLGLYIGTFLRCFKFADLNILWKGLSFLMLYFLLVYWIFLCCTCLHCPTEKEFKLKRRRNPNICLQEYVSFRCNKICCICLWCLVMLLLICIEICYFWWGPVKECILVDYGRLKYEELRSSVNGTTDLLTQFMNYMQRNR